MILPTEMMNDELHRKLEQLGIVIERVDGQDNIVAKIKEWCQPFIQQRARLELKVRAKRVYKRSKGKVYEYAKIELTLPARYAGREFRISELEFSEN